MTRAIILIGLSACGRIDFTPRGDSTLADTAVSQDPIGWWKLDEGTGATAADSSGNGNPGTLSAGVGWGVGPRGPVLLIPDGIIDNEQLDVGDPTAFHLSGSMTVTAWANLSSANPSTPDDVIIGRDDFEHGDVRGWALKGTEDSGPETFALQIFDGGTLVQRTGLTVASFGTWYHVAGVFDAAARRLDIYVDGMLDNGMLEGIIPPAQDVPATPVHTQIANSNPYSPTVGGASIFHGMLFDVRLYDRALTASEIMQVAKP